MRRLLPALALLATPLCAAQDLPSDPRLTTGQLDNGLKYIIMPHNTPPGRAALWMHVSSGSLNETEAQRGLAHFLEHMAFNGSENFPPGSVIHYFESLGMTFGRDQNAFTNMEQTTYQLSLPDNKPETLNKGLMFFSDVNSKLLLSPKEIDAERGVILNEKTTRKSAQQRLGDLMLERMAPGSLYSRRNTIGIDETLMSVQRQDFVDYYSKWYGPANTTMIVVADMEPAAIIKEITARFATSGAKKATVPPDQDPGITPYKESFAVVATDPELTRGSVGVTVIDRATPPITTKAQQREEWVEDLAQSAFNRRISNLVAKGVMPFRGGNASGGQQGRLMRTASANASGSPEKWREMLTAIITEVQRARVHGLRQSELDEVRTDLLAGMEQAVRSEETQPASAFLARINGAVAAGRPIQSAQQRLDLAKELMPTITADECSKAFAKQFDFSRAMFTVQLPTSATNPSEADVLKAGMTALIIEVEPLPEETHAKALMEKLPEAVKVLDVSAHEAAGVTSAWLANGVRLHHKFMDERKDSVAVSITLYGGELDETAATKGITGAAALGLGGGGGGGGRGGRGGGGGGRAATMHLTSADIRSLMSGKNVRVSGRAGADAIQVSINGDPADLEHGFQLAHLLLTEPLIEQPAFDQWKETTLQGLAGIDKNPVQMFSKVEAETRYPIGEVRTSVLSPANVNAITRDAAQARLMHLLKTSPIEVSIVGDITKDRAVALAAQYIGSLPARDRVTTGAFMPLRTLPAPKGPRAARVEMNTLTDQAGASVGFYGPDRSNIADSRAMTMTAAIVSSRMIAVIREEKALVYSIRCGFSAGTTFPGYGLVRAGAPCQPINADALAPAIREVFDNFAKTGPTAEEIDTAKKQMANTLDESMRQPGFWDGVLSSMTYDGVSLDDTLAAKAAYQAMTAEDIAKVFNKYYTPERTVTVIVNPKGTN